MCMGGQGKRESDCEFERCQSCQLSIPSTPDPVLVCGPPLCTKSLEKLENQNNEENGCTSIRLSVEI